MILLSLSLGRDMSKGVASLASLSLSLSLPRTQGLLLDAYGSFAYPGPYRKPPVRRTKKVSKTQRAKNQPQNPETGNQKTPRNPLTC